MVPAAGSPGAAADGPRAHARSARPVAGGVHGHPGGVATRFTTEMTAVAHFHLIVSFHTVRKNFVSYFFGRAIADFGRVGRTLR